MLDNPLIALVIKALIAGEAAAGIPGTPIKQAFQPTVQGVNTAPTAYIYFIDDELVGNVRYDDKYDTINNVMVHTETQQVATTLQASALATQNPNTPGQKTAKDILRLIASILRSQVTVATLQASGVGIQNIKRIRNPYFQDDRQQNEASPSFDFVLTHKEIIVTETPSTTQTEIQVVQF